MASAHSRLAAVLVTAASAAAFLGAASTAVANDQHNGDLPVMIVSPAPGKITKEHKVTDTYQFDPKASSSDSPGSPPQPPVPSMPDPGAVTSAKDAANNTALAATSGASNTVDSLLK